MYWGIRKKCFYQIKYFSVKSFSNLKRRELKIDYSKVKFPLSVKQNEKC